MIINLNLKLKVQKYCTKSKRIRGIQFKVITYAIVVHQLKGLQWTSEAS